MRKGIFALLVIMAGLFLYLLPPGTISLSALQHSQAEFAHWHAQHPVLAVMAFFGCYFLTAAFSIPGATLLTLLGGAIFGLVQGTLLVALAATAGATVAMLISRYLLRDWVQRRFSRMMEKVNQGIRRDGGHYLFALRLAPVFPFVLVNLLMGLTPMGVVRYAAISLLGMLPAIVVYINTGRQLSQLQSLGDILSPGMMLVFALLGLLPLAARWLARRTAP
ncbi:TVP38/TMEM64 family protein [Enterobacter sp. Ap-1006]|uniref:TVP38/TMEM64 family protein n=1 Tax=Enterobacter sp. Ap-1006 TaxID=2608345 RepID=UPI00336AA8EC|nr:TVP38/TMEM64 family protein [Enterobacter sp. Ap-1006]